MAAGVPDIPGHQVPPNIVGRLQREVANLLERSQVQFPGAQPVSFSRRHIESELLREDYFVCEKSDGLRCLLFLTAENNEERAYLITRTNDYFWIPDLHFPRRESPSSFHVGVLVDGELVRSVNATGPPQLRFLMFDCLAMDGKSLVSRTLDKRLGFLRQELYDPYRDLCIKFPDDVKIFPFQVAVKPVERSYGLAKVFNELVPRLTHGTDGLIFTSSEQPYIFGTDEKILKWKPPEENTVDFMLSLEFPIYQDPDSSDSYPDYDSKPVFQLLAWQGGDDHRPFDQLYVTDEEWDKLKALNEPLDERIVEAYKDTESRWRYLRFRDDKESGNHITVVHKVMESIADAVSKEELIAASDKIKDSWKDRERRRDSVGGGDRRSSTAGRPPFGTVKRPSSVMIGGDLKRVHGEE